jgi:hypothetical protein
MKEATARADMSVPENVLAVALSAQHAVELLQSQVSQSMQNVVSRLDAMDSHMREQGRAIQVIHDQVADMRSHSEGLERLARAIDRSTTENMVWREKHEADNKGVSDSLTAMRGGARTGAWVAALLITVSLAGAGLWINAELVNIRADRVAGAEYSAKERDRIERQAAERRAELQKQVDTLEAQVQELREMRGLR